MTTTKSITTSQTIGPFFHDGLDWGVVATRPAVPQALTIRGTVFDGAGQPVPDALLEAWLPHGAVDAGAGIPGFRRVLTVDAGRFEFALPARPDAGQPAAFVTVFARGLLKHQFCAVFLADDAAVNASPLLAQVPADRRATLIANTAGDSAYQWDIHLQGDRETVFFDYR